MLVLSRKAKEALLFFVPGMQQPIKVVVSEVFGNRVSLCIDADPTVKVLRLELELREQSDRQTGS